MSIFVTKEQIEKFTGCKTQDAQRLAMTRRKIKYIENFKGVALTIAEFNRTPENEWPNNVLPSAKEIKSLPALPRSISGIYFLSQGKDIVYIGKTTNLYSRIGSHADGKYEFDSVRFLPTHIKNLDAMEREYIARFCPKYNIAHKPIYADAPNYDAVFEDD